MRTLHRTQVSTVPYAGIYVKLPIYLASTAFISGRLKAQSNSPPWPAQARAAARSESSPARTRRLLQALGAIAGPAELAGAKAGAHALAAVPCSMNVTSDVVVAVAVGTAVEAAADCKLPGLRLAVVGVVARSRKMLRGL